MEDEQYYGEVHIETSVSSCVFFKEAASDLILAGGCWKVETGVRPGGFRGHTMVKVKLEARQY